MKENEHGRIAKAMLELCRLVWEYCTRNPNQGEFRLSEVLQGFDSKKAPKSRVGLVSISMKLVQYPEVLREKLNAIDGVQVDHRSHEVTITDGGFKCQFMLKNIFDMTARFLRYNCPNLAGKVVFGNNGSGRYANFPDMKPAAKPAAAVAAAKTINNPQPPVDLAELLRQALLARVA